MSRVRTKLVNVLERYFVAKVLLNVLKFHLMFLNVLEMDVQFIDADIFHLIMAL